MPSSSRSRSSWSSAASQRAAKKAVAAATSVANREVTFPSWSHLRAAILTAARQVRRFSAKRDDGMAYAWERHLHRLVAEGEPMITPLTPAKLASHLQDPSGMLLTVWPAIVGRLEGWSDQRATARLGLSPREPRRTTASLDSWIRETCALTLAQPLRDTDPAGSPAQRPTLTRAERVSEAYRRLLPRLIRQHAQLEPESTIQLWLADALRQHAAAAQQLAAVVTTPPTRRGTLPKPLAALLAEGGPVLDYEITRLLIERTRRGSCFLDGPHLEAWIQTEAELQQAIQRSAELWPEHAARLTAWGAARRASLTGPLSQAFDEVWAKGTPEGIMRTFLASCPTPEEQHATRVRWGTAILARELRQGGTWRTGTGQTPRAGEGVTSVAPPPFHPIEAESLAALSAAPDGTRLLEQTADVRLSSTSLSHDLLVRWLVGSAPAAPGTFAQVAAWLLASIPAPSARRLLEDARLAPVFQALPGALRPWLQHPDRPVRLAAIQLAGQIQGTGGAPEPVSPPVPSSSPPALGPAR